MWRSAAGESLPGNRQDCRARRLLRGAARWGGRRLCLMCQFPAANPGGMGAKPFGLSIRVGLLCAIIVDAMGCTPSTGAPANEKHPTRLSDGDRAAKEKLARPARAEQIVAGTSAVPALDACARSTMSRSGAEPTPLNAESALISLPIPKYGDAIVWLPLGATSPRPVIVATHGNYDTPESTCDVWGGIVADRGFVLCPRGVPRSDSPSRKDLVYHYLSVVALKKEIDAALVALAATYAAYLDTSDLLYSGFSQGAIMGTYILQEQAERFPRAVLIEGGSKQWNHYTVQRYAKGGGRRILFACGQWGCENTSKKAVKYLERSGVLAQMISAPRSGHTYGGAVAEQIAGAFDWLVEGDERWQVLLFGGRQHTAAGGRNGCPEP